MAVQILCGYEHLGAGRFPGLFGGANPIPRLLDPEIGGPLVVTPGGKKS